MAVKILVVEDEKKLNTMIADYLKALEYDVVSSYDGPAALRIFRQEEPDLVVLDYMLPGIDGLDVLRKIREQSEIKRNGWVGVAARNINGPGQE